ncbi:MAG: helix-turn-helix domain-containing protein [Actinomycetia bacterium]|nr:helix-turn-helix domain-containing protein [Actinomycetes bacterium]
MEINLHVIVEDLIAYRPKSHLVDEYSVRRLRFPVIYDGQKTRRSLLYILEATSLSAEAIDNIVDNSSLVVIGEPPKTLLDKPVNLVWVSQSVSLPKLFNEIVEYFSMYELWENHIQRALISKKRLKRLAELSAPIVRRPMYLIDSHMQTIFANIDEEAYDLPLGYQNPVIDNNNPSIGIYALERFQEKSYSFTTPFVLPTHNGYRTLNQNIFIENSLAGTLSFDEIGGPFTNRDMTLITLLADYIANGMTFHEEWNTSAPKQLDVQVHRLLENQVTVLEETDAALKSIAWGMDNAYYCIVAVPLNPLYPNGLLAAAAKHTCTRTSQTIYTVHEHRMVFIVNADHSTLAQNETLDILATELEKLNVYIGVSNIFNGFWGLTNQYNLAVAACELGPQRHGARPYYRFEDYFMDYVVSVCKSSTTLESIIPRGLIQLKRYDEKYETNMLHILGVFLKHDMRIASAARELFLHRNTLTAKISQIKFITRLDFEDNPEIRLQTLVALYMMDA